MNQTLGLLRHILTAVGGMLLMYGIGSEGSMSEVIGALMTATGGIWSWFKNAPVTE